MEGGGMDGCLKHFMLVYLTTFHTVNVDLSAHAGDFCKYCIPSKVPSALIKMFTNDQFSSLSHIFKQRGILSHLLIGLVNGKGWMA